MACWASCSGAGHVGHHQEAGDVHAELAGGGDVLGGDVGLGAVGGDADRADAEVVGALQVVDGADAGQQQGGEPGVLQHRCGGLDPLPVGVGAGPVVDRAAGEAVAVGDLDRVDAGGVEGGDDALDVVWGDAVADGVHAVAQGDVLDEDRGAHRLASLRGGDPLGHLQRGGGHDVEVAGVRRQVVGGALDLEEHRDLVGRRGPRRRPAASATGWSAGISVTWTCCLSR